MISLRSRVLTRKLAKASPQHLAGCKTAMGARAQFAVFTYAEMWQTPRYEIRSVAFFADNLMNSVAHCGW